MIKANQGKVHVISKYKCQAFFVSALLVIGSIGCAPDSISEVELPIPPAAKDAKTGDESLNTIAVKQVADATSPATNVFVLPSADTPPDVVCKQFLELLNLEDANSFELLLTPAALNVANRLKFHLPPIADAATKFTVAEPAYGTIREKLCFVDCKFDDAENVENSTLTVMMRKTRSGWRIAGMMVDGEQTGTQNLLSFENSKDVLQIKSSVEDVSVETVDN